MKDTDSLVVQAFLAALTLQTQPLPPDIQTQLNTLAESLDIPKLDHLFESFEPLSLEYEKAYNYLTNHANQLRKGRDFKPNAISEIEDNTNTEIDNTASRIQPSDDRLGTILNNIQKRLAQQDVKQLAEETFRNSNPVASAQLLFLSA